MSEIRINLERAYQQAGRLDDAADDLGRELRKILNAKSDIPSYWEGNASSVYIRKLEEQYSDLLQLQRQLQNIASKIRRVADHIRAIEEAAQKSAQKL